MLQCPWNKTPNKDSLALLGCNGGLVIDAYNFLRNRGWSAGIYKNDPAFGWGEGGGIEFQQTNTSEQLNMGKLDETISDVSALKRTANAQHSKILAMRESLIRTMHASNDVLKKSI